MVLFALCAHVFSKAPNLLAFFLLKADNWNRYVISLHLQVIKLLLCISNRVLHLQQLIQLMSD